MKLRIKGMSLRLRVSLSEVTRVRAGFRIEETIHFTDSDGAALTYGLESAKQHSPVTLRYKERNVTVVLSEEQARNWTGGNDVGVYCSLSVGSKGFLEVIVEKDFACLDGSEADEEDTFPNPLARTHCRV